LLLWQTWKDNVDLWKLSQIRFWPSRQLPNIIKCKFVLSSVLNDIPTFNLDITLYDQKLQNKICFFFTNIGNLCNCHLLLNVSFAKVLVDHYQSITSNATKMQWCLRPIWVLMRNCIYYKKDLYNFYTKGFMSVWSMLYYRVSNNQQ